MDEQELKLKITELVPRVDLESTGLKKFVKLLSKETGVNLKPQKDFIKQCLTEAIEAQQSSDEEENDVDEEESESEEEETPKKRRGGGLTAKKEISDELANFLGKGKEMARTDVVKSLWEYIREHNLQNEENKREILLDSRMQDVFGCESFTMFTMNKYVSAHIHPFTPVDLTPTPSKPRKRKAASKKEGSEKKKRKAGSQPPYHLSETLQAVVGSAILPRPQVVSKIWEYIRSKELQDPSNRRNILCDEQLTKVMGKKKVTMFEMNKLIGKHFIEKADPSEYVHPDPDSDWFVGLWERTKRPS